MTLGDRSRVELPDSAGSHPLFADLTDQKPPPTSGPARPLSAFAATQVQGRTAVRLSLRARPQQPHRAVDSNVDQYYRR
jgi:hypothetical protein